MCLLRDPVISVNPPPGKNKQYYSGVWEKGHMFTARKTYNYCTVCKNGGDD